MVSLDKVGKVAVSALAAGSLLVSVAACSMGSSSSDSSGDPADTTLNVWVMTGDLDDKTVAAINDEFTKQTGAKVKVQTQQWDNIVTKVTTALSTSTPPDVVDLGNTQVPGFAASGGLLDLTKYKSDLQDGNEWLAGLEDPATVDGKLYGVPSFGAARVVVYNKTLWAKSGITEAPTTYEELQADLDKIAADNSGTADFAPFYMPGQYWYSGLQFIWDAGGDIAADDGGTWKGSASSADSIKGLEAWKAFENKYSTNASRSLDEANPDQSQLLATGKTSAILANSVAPVFTANPDLKDDEIGTFPFPSISGSGTQPSMIAGSDWGIAAKSKNSDLAVKWVKIAASSDIQEKYVYGTNGWIPNSVNLVDSIMSSADFPAQKKGFFEAAKNSKATPASPNWSTIEGDKSINDMFSAIATGSQSVQDAAKTFDSHADEVLAK